MVGWLGGLGFGGWEAERDRERVLRLIANKVFSPRLCVLLFAYVCLVFLSKRGLRKCMGIKAVEREMSI